MILSDIFIRENVVLKNVEYFESGYLKGYVTAMLIDQREEADYKDYGYYTLFRVHDPENGNDMTLVSVDYGWYLNDDTIITDTENKLKETMEAYL